MEHVMSNGIEREMFAMEQRLVATDEGDAFGENDGSVIWSAEEDGDAFRAVARRAFVEDIPLLIYTVEGYEVSWMVTGVETDGVWGYDQGQAGFALILRCLERYGDMPPLFLPRARVATMIAAMPDAFSFAF